ncbi:MAG: DUF2851 family protein [Bacteroidetes bacterium]|nr:DUF2851 family protein [Bacteroidota bacterium]
MQEEFIHFIWQTTSFDTRELKATTGETIEIIEAGQLQHNSGPDFENAIIRINGQMWAGNVEIHLQSSDWFDHNHDSDRAYDSVILHVCYACNREVFRSNGSRIPCLEIGSRIFPKLRSKYDWLLQSSSKLTCASFLNDVQPEIKNEEITLRFLNRMEFKIQSILKVASKCEFDWNAVMYRYVCRAFGAWVNSQPFELLSRRLSFNLISKYADKPNLIEALFFGVAGFLYANKDEIPRDEYEHALVNEFRFLSKKHNLTSISTDQWKFMRLRPANFPTIRLAQLSALMSEKPELYSEMKDLNSWKMIRNTFKTEPSEYWKSHYRLGEISNSKAKIPGSSLIQNIAINAIIPVRLANAHWKNDLKSKNELIRVMTTIPSENNKVVRMFLENGFEIPNAAGSQGAYQLYHESCMNRNCLHCGIGKTILEEPEIETYTDKI